MVTEGQEDGDRECHCHGCRRRGRGHSIGRGCRHSIDCLRRDRPHFVTVATVTLVMVLLVRLSRARLSIL